MPRGEYRWTSFHHDTQHIHGFFEIEISIDGGTSYNTLGQSYYISDNTAGGNPDSDDPGNGFPGPQDGPDAENLVYVAAEVDGALSIFDPFWKP